MIIDQVLNERPISSTDGMKTKSMGISANAAEFIFLMYIKNTYSNPIGSVVREITSNCFDSHVEAKVSTPVLIKKGSDENSGLPYISFIDFGVGMSVERIDETYSELLCSTKRDTNDLIGGFGLGSKTPLAYNRQSNYGSSDFDNSFFVITIFDNIKYVYCIYDGEKTPAISLLHQEETDEHNGTEVRVPILGKDVSKFENEIIKQLYYFENIVFEGFDNEKIVNEFNIVRADNFFYRGYDYSRYMHLCLGKVAYPIDYGVLGVDCEDYKFPVALRFEIGDINVVSSREAVDYSEKSIKLIKNKLAAAKKEIMGLISAQYESVTTLEDYFQFKYEFGKLYFPKNISMKTESVKIKDIKLNNFIYDHMEIPNDVGLFDLCFLKTETGKKLKKYSRNSKVFKGAYADLENNNVIRMDEGYKRKMLTQAWLRDEHETYYIIKEHNPLSVYEIKKLFGVNTNELTNIDGTNTSEYDDILQLCADYVAIVNKKVMSYDEIQVPEGFTASRNVKARSQEDITITVINSSNRGDKNTIKFEKLMGFKGSIVYGTYDEKYALMQAAMVYEGIFSPRSSVVDSYSTYYGFYDDSDQKKNKVLFLMISKAKVKKLNLLKDVTHVDDVYSRFFHRKASYVKEKLVSSLLYEAYSDLNEFYKMSDLSLILPDLAIKVKELSKFVSNKSLSYFFRSSEKAALNQYFDVDITTIPTEFQKFYDTINEVKDLTIKNKDIFKYLDIPSYGFSGHPVFCEMVKSLIIK